VRILLAIAFCNVSVSKMSVSIMDNIQNYIIRSKRQQLSEPGFPGLEDFQEFFVRAAPRGCSLRLNFSPTKMEATP
jgi:hypothetical protein